jgi:hypothetical protein
MDKKLANLSRNKRGDGAVSSGFGSGWVVGGGRDFWGTYGWLVGGR